MEVQIYKPVKNPMQSGKGNTKQWYIKYKNSTTRYIESVMGWTGNSDTKSQLNLKFDTKEEAIAYATSNNLDYNVVEPKKSKIIIQTYSDNFS